MLIDGGAGSDIDPLTMVGELPHPDDIGLGEFFWKQDPHRTGKLVLGFFLLDLERRMDTTCEYSHVWVGLVDQFPNLRNIATVTWINHIHLVDWEWYKK